MSWSKTQRDLAGLKREGLICNEVEELAAHGYQKNFSIGPGERLQSLTAATLGHLFELTVRIPVRWCFIIRFPRAPAFWRTRQNRGSCRVCITSRRS